MALDQKRIQLFTPPEAAPALSSRTSQVSVPPLCSVLSTRRSANFFAQVKYFQITHICYTDFVMGRSKNSLHVRCGNRGITFTKHCDWRDLNMLDFNRFFQLKKPPAIPDNKLSLLTYREHFMAHLFISNVDNCLSLALLWQLVRKRKPTWSFYSISLAASPQRITPS